MLKKLCLLGGLLLLTGCNPPPLPVQAMLPNDAVYNQIPKEFYLQHKIRLGSIVSSLPPKPLNKDYNNILYQDYRAALLLAMAKANLLTETSKAEYELSADLKDVGNPSCFFGTCKTGSTIEYELKRIKTDKSVYKQLVVVPYNYDYPMFGSDIGLVIRATLGGALGNNFAQVIHILADKNKKDLL